MCLHCYLQEEFLRTLEAPLIMESDEGAGEGGGGEEGVAGVSSEEASSQGVSSHEGDWRMSSQLRLLLRNWRERAPSAKDAPAAAWDDLLCGRRLMLARIQQALRRQLGARVHEQTERRLVEATFERAAARSVLALGEAAADAARLQGNFGAAKSFTGALRGLRRLTGGGGGERVGEHCTLFRLLLERAGARGKGGERWREALEQVRAKAEHLWQEASGEAPFGERAELRQLQATVAFELAEGGGDARADARADTAAGGRLLTEARRLLEEAIAIGESGRGAAGGGAAGAGRAGAGPARARPASGVHLDEQRLLLAEMCDRALQRDALGVESGAEGVDGGSRRVELVRAAAMHLLRAMQGGLAAAQERLPKLLQMASPYSSLWPELSEALLRLPRAPLLKWAPQLLALLNEPHGAAVAPLLVELARDYPQALYFPYQTSRRALEARRHLAPPSVREALATLEVTLRSPLLSAFVAACEDLTDPSLRLKDELEDVLSLLRPPYPEPLEAQRRYIEARAAWLCEGSRGGVGSGGGASREPRGTLLVAVAKAILPKLDKCLGAGGERLLEPNAAAAVLSALKEAKQLAESVEKQRGAPAGRKQLDSYSAWLARYHRAAGAADGGGGGALGVLEVPRRPAEAAELGRGGVGGEGIASLGSSRIVVEGFGAELLVMASLRKPKRITAHCSDQQERRFLVKGGEDLRCDQRVQQVFSAMNGVLARDPAAAARALSLRTYTVTPLNDRVGLLEWMDGTPPPTYPLLTPSPPPPPT